MSLRIIAGKFKGRFLKTPKSTTTRPTQGALREAVFNICQMNIVEAQVLDLFAGSGAIGFEALSRGASHVTMIERDKQAISCIKKNCEDLEVTAQVTLLSLDAESALRKLTKPFDIIYVDPPYDLPLGPILEPLAEKNLLSPHGTLFVEERYDPKRKTTPPALKNLLLKSSRRFGTAILHEYHIGER